MNKAFTLAETLITLTVIGVVAALTLPSVISKYKEKQTITQLKKVYSTLSQSYLYAQILHGQPSEWATEKTPEQMDLFLDNLTSQIKILEKCNADVEGCWTDHTSLSGVSRSANELINHSKLITADGLTMTFYLNAPDCDYGTLQICGGLHVDLNGYKKPNVYGKDTFIFFVTKNGIVAAGGVNEGSNNNEGNEFNFKDNCSTSSTFRKGIQAGLGCTAWVLQNENMDYLHCDNLSWDGKKTCK